MRAKKAKEEEEDGFGEASRVTMTSATPPTAFAFGAKEERLHHRCLCYGASSLFVLWRSALHHRGLCYGVVRCIIAVCVTA